MALWRITAKYSGSAVCKNKKAKIREGYVCRDLHFDNRVAS